MSLTVQFTPEINLIEFPAYWQRFFKIVPWGYWSLRKKRFEDTILRNPFARPYVLERFGLEMKILNIHLYHQKSGRFPNISQHPQFATAFSFITTVAMLHQRLSAEGKVRLAGMLKDGVQDDINGIAPLAYELRVATHLFSQGFDVEFIDLEGRGRYDFLVSKDDLAFEIECKHLSGDFVRTVHSKKLIQFGGELFSRLKIEKIGFEGCNLINLVLQNRLTNQTRQHHHIIDGVISLLKGNDTKYEASDFVASRESINSEILLKIDAAINENKSEGFSNAIDQQLNLGGETIAGYLNKKRLLAVNFKLAHPVIFIDAWVKQLRVAIDGQFSGKNPCVICANLPEISDDQLVRIADREAPDMTKTTTLHRIANAVAAKDKLGKLETIAFMSQGSVTTGVSNLGDFQTNAIQHSGAAYSFNVRKDGDNGHPRIELFAPDRRKVDGRLTAFSD